jgi:hypothetical protein
MGKWKKRRRWGQSRGQGEPLSAKLPIVFLLANVFVWAGLRGTDILLVTLLSTIFGFTGMVIAYRAKHNIRRKGGRVSGETMALIGYWANLVIFLLAFLLFAYSVAMGVLRGELL